MYCYALFHKHKVFKVKYYFKCGYTTKIKRLFDFQSVENVFASYTLYQFGIVLVIKKSILNCQIILCVLVLVYCLHLD